MERFNRGDGRRPNFRREFGPRPKFKAICYDCKQECEVPFQPREGRPVFCNDCFQNHRTG